MLARAIQHGVFGALELFKRACPYPNLSYVDDTAFDRQIIANVYDYLIDNPAFGRAPSNLDEALRNRFSSPSPIFKRYRAADVKISTLRAGDVLDLGGGVKFRVIWPQSLVKLDKINNQSVVAKLIFGDFSMLFTGDIEAQAEDFLRSADVKADVLKVAHHGSKSSSTADFISNVNPDYAFISAGLNNKFSHPHKITLRTILNSSFQIAFHTSGLSSSPYSRKKIFW